MTEEISKQVEARVAQEKKVRAAKKKDTSGGEKKDPLNSKFVMDCLDAEQLGDGILYAALHKDRFIFAKNSQQWFYWDDRTWRLDELDKAISAVETVSMRYGQEIEVLQKKIDDARESDDDEEYSFRKRIYSKKISRIRARISVLRKDAGRSNCLKFSHTNPKNQLAITGREFDMDPWLLGVENGVVNLRTGELEPSVPGDFILKRCGVTFGGLDIDLSVFEKILDSIYDNDREKIKFIQRLFGSALVGNSSEHVLPVMIGRGRNGKTKLIEAISFVMGDYAGVVPAEILLDSNRPANYNQSDPTMMDLKGLRMALCSETGEGKKFSSERVKWLTGGDTLVARGLYDKQPTKFEPSHMLVLLTNHEPGAPAGDLAFWERCFLIHHPFTFVKREPKEDYERRADPDLAEKLKEAGPAILTWLVTGCLEWQKRGLDPPESVIKSTQQYREQEDYIGQFIESCCEIKKGSRIGATILYNTFEIWYRKTINAKKHFTPSQKVFGSKMRGREKFPPKKISGKSYYEGLELNDEYQQIMLDPESSDDPRGSSAQFEGRNNTHF